MQYFFRWRCFVKLTGFDDFEQGIKKSIVPFFEDMLAFAESEIHSIYLTGSVLTGGFSKKVSDINSLVVVKEVTFPFVKHLALIGKQYKKKRIAPPLVMSEECIRKSQDLFPIEFFNLKLAHRIIYGDNLLQGISIGKQNLKQHCDLAIKSKLRWLIKEYLSSMGDKQLILANIIQSLSGFISLFRSVLYLMNLTPPLRFVETLTLLTIRFGPEMTVFQRIHEMKIGSFKPSHDDLDSVFEECYLATKKIAFAVEELAL